MAKGAKAKPADGSKVARTERNKAVRAARMKRKAARFALWARDAGEPHKTAKHRERRKRRRAAAAAAPKRKPRMHDESPPTLIVGPSRERETLGDVALAAVQ